MTSFSRSDQAQDFTIKVLLAEDSLILGEVLKLNLEEEGLKVNWAANGREAVDRFTEEHFDVVITDFEMPILNGDQVCDAIRNELQSDVPIIMCTAKGMELDFERLSKRYKISALLQKPFSIVELASLAREFSITKSVA